MATVSQATDELRCSFCGKSESEVAKLVAGPGVYICDVCVNLAADIIEQYRDKPVAPRLPAWGSLTDEQMLDHLPRVAAVAAEVETNLRAWVRELRRRKVTWTRIGAALGISRQSAWERFSGEE